MVGESVCADECGVGYDGGLASAAAEDGDAVDSSEVMSDSKVVRCGDASEADVVKVVG